MSKGFKKIVLRILIVAIFLAGVYFSLATRYVVPIMMYHNVKYSDKYEPNTVSPEHFAYHMDFLKRNHFNVLSLEELVNTVNRGENLPGKSVVITFDDGYENNYTYAMPVLEKHGFPAIVFLPSDDINTEGFLNTAQIKEMMQKGFTIGSHTRTQAYLPNESYESQRNEILESKRLLEELFDVPVKYFCYPNGGFSEQIKSLVKEAGYLAATATNRGYDRFNKDVYELNRIRFGDRDIHDYNLWAKLSGYYNFFRKAKNPY